MTKILDGKILSQLIAKKLAKKIALYPSTPTLAIIQVGDVSQSSQYIGRKKIFAEKIGAKVFHIILEKKVSGQKVLELIHELNERRDIHGIIVQLPLPGQLDRYEIMEAIDPKKDVDGLNSRNAGLIYESAFGGQDPKNVPKGLIPATAKGVLSLLEHYKVSLEGKKVLIVGRSLLVGKPVAMLCLRKNATVTIAHRKTKNLEKLCRESDVVIVAAGKAGLIGKKALQKGQVIVDVGTNALKGPKTLEEIPKFKIIGDVVWNDANGLVGAISPVPGGVGPMTVASLFENLVEAFLNQK